MQSSAQFDTAIFTNDITGEDPATIYYDNCTIADWFRRLWNVSYAIYYDLLHLETPYKVLS